MYYTPMFVEAGGLIEAKPTGELNSETIVLMAKTLLEAIAKYESTMLLVDCRGCTVNLDAIDIYTLPPKVGPSRFPKDTKLAMIMPSKYKEKSQFVETVFTNAGCSLTFFEDRESAQQWLLP